MTFIAAIRIVRLLEHRMHLRRGVMIGLLIVGSLFALIIAALPLVGLYRDRIIPLVQDPFAAGNLMAAVPWHWAECLIGLLYLVGIWVAVFLMRKHFNKGIVLLAALQIVMIQVTMLHITPKVEAYSQRAAIDYFKSFVGKDVYVQVLGYKSYAHLFYSRKEKSMNPSYYRTVVSAVGSSPVIEPNEDWLLYGPVDKPAYFICKVSDAKDWRTVKQLEEIGGKNGFVFFRRRPY
jgi:hypothetical protein